MVANTNPPIRQDAQDLGFLVTYARRFPLQPTQKQELLSLHVRRSRLRIGTAQTVPYLQNFCRDGLHRSRPAHLNRITLLWRTTNPLKIALEVTPHLEPLFGTRDENLRLMEDSLGVRIDLRSDAVRVEGPDERVIKVQRTFRTSSRCAVRASIRTMAN